MTDTSLSTSRLVQYLPAMYQEDVFIGQFLSAFEKILHGRDPKTGVEFPFTGWKRP